LASRFPRALSLAALLGLAGLLAGFGDADSADAANSTEAPEAPKAPPSPLTIEAVRIEPAAPAADTLCRLAVTLKNAGEKAASRLELRVKVNGAELPAYRKLVHLARVPPGGTLDLPLFNFWSTQTGRPAPADGKLTVEVSLAGAAWVQSESANGVETWKPAVPAHAPADSPADAMAKSAVAGLPVAKTLTLTLTAKPQPPPPKQR
jgi:hypothetical protein